MVSRLPPSAKISFTLIEEIIRMGAVDIPPGFQGTGAPGHTLEFLLNVKNNNADSPDLNDWEIKFHGGNSLLTLFHKDPQPKGIVKSIVDKYGWENDKHQICFRHTIKGKSDRGFQISSIDNKIVITNPANPDIVPYWEHNIILNAIGAKLRRLILVHGKVDKVNRKVIYNKASAYWDFDITGIIDAIVNGLIYIDFDVRTTKLRGSSLRDHGTKFRVHINDIGSIYENAQVIV